MEERKEEKEARAFQEEMKYFLSKAEFNMFDFHEKVLAGLKSKSAFQTYIYGDDKEIADLEIQNKVISAMFDEEKAKGYFDTLARKEIAKVAGVRGGEVSDTIRKYKHMRSFHGWLLQR